MNAYVNELSLHGQFESPTAFLDALRHLLRMHRHCARFNTSMFCSRVMFAQRPVVAGSTARAVIYAHASREIRSLFLAWLDRSGPFWDDAPLHDQQAWFVVRNGGREEIATQTGLAECLAYCLAGGRGVTVSVAPSDYAYTPVSVETEPRGGGGPIRCPLDNFWELGHFAAVLVAEQPLESWADLERSARARFGRLCIAGAAFQSLENQPYSRAVAEDIVMLLDVLDRLSGCVGDDGRLDASGTELHKTYFTGHRPRFTDSSDDEKATFRQALTFVNPHTGVHEMFSWHGKVRMDRQYRIHFEWPKRDPSRPLPVVFIGQKLTRR